MGHRSRFLGAVLAVAISAAGAVGVVSASPVSAIDSSGARSAPTGLTGSTSLSPLGLVAGVVDGVAASATVNTALTWEQAAMVVTQFDPDAVRRGAALDPVDSFTRSQPGSMALHWSLDGLIVGSGEVSPISIGTMALDAVGACDLLAGSPDYACHFESDDTAADTGDAGVDVRARLTADVTVTPQGVATLREASLGENPAGEKKLTLGEAPVVDTYRISCAADLGDHLGYTLGALSSTPGISVQTNLVLTVGSSIPAVFPVEATTAEITMTGNGAAFDLGAVQESNLAPVADPGGPYVGTEGSPITFDGSQSRGGCGAAVPALHWEFSDGGSAEGTMPLYAFADDGTYTGELTATDANGVTATAPFTVTVENAAPSADAGPDATVEQGQPVSFSGHGSDPGPTDQNTLLYVWDFGDGTPAANGQNVTHVYATPGASGYYDATLTVCDTDGECASDTRRVSVTAATTQQRQPVWLVPFGDFLGRANSTVALRALLIDRSGKPLPGRTVSFQLGSQSASATTDARGLATASLRLNQRSGLYRQTATWTPVGADAAAYVGSSVTLPFLVLPR